MRKIGIEAAPLLALCAATAVFFLPLVQRPDEILVGPQRGGNNDLTAYFLAVHEYPALARDRFGQWPMWNPYQLAGTPYVGNPQSGWMYPPNGIFYFAAAPVAASWLLAFHHLWAAVGAYVLCRTLSLGRTAATLGGVLFAGAPYWIAHTGEGHLPQICVVAWIPWALWAYERFRESRPASAPLLSLVMAMCFLAGHPQEMYYLACLLAVLAACDAVRIARELGIKPALHWLRQGALAGVAVLGLVAVELAPTLVYARLGVRGAGMSAQDAGWGLETANLMQLVWPWALGGPATYHRPPRMFWETVCYFGAVPLVLAGAGLALGWRRYAVKRWAGLFAIALTFAFGAASPVFLAFYFAVPGIALFRAPSRALFFCAAAVGLLAAVGVDLLLQRYGRSRNGRLLVGACLGLCVIELAAFSHAVLRTTPQSDSRSDLTRHLSELAPTERVLAEQHLLSEREAQRIGAARVQAYEPAPLIHFVTAIHAMHPRAPTTTLLGLERVNLAELHQPLVDLLGVRYALVTSAGKEIPPGWRVVASGRRPAEFHFHGATRMAPYVLLENETPLPKAFIVGRAVTPDPDAELHESLRRIDPRREVLLAKDVLADGPRSEFRRATIVKYTPGRVIVDAELDEPGYLVLSDVWYPGWRAAVDGRQTAVLMANAAFRAVPLTPGKHRIEFVYRTPGLLLGAAISALTLLALSWSVLGHATRRRRTTVGSESMKHDSDIQIHLAPPQLQGK